MPLYTIGFTKKSAARFFDLLNEHDVDLLIDTRLNPGGQLSGFARKADLPYLLRHLSGCEYRHEPLLAPTAELLADYRRDHDWDRYAARFETLMDERDIPAAVVPILGGWRASCLLCSEATPDRCHRRLVAERLARTLPGLEVVHLV